jgi:nickel/cobalt transporter (NicO) family protein
MDMLAQATVLGAWFGLLHAFDADHLATIGGLAVRDRSLSPSGYALRWALGHAAAIVLMAAAVLGAGLTRLLDLSAYAELLVCAALFAIGLQALNAARRSLRAAPNVRAHARTETARHVHFLAPWHSHAARRGATSVLMGLLHGGAGSAAVLALLPLARFDGALSSALYLVCFSFGVAAGALAFARGFAAVASRSATAGARLGAAFQAAVGSVAIASGALLLYELLHGGG